MLKNFYKLKFIIIFYSFSLFSFQKKDSIDYTKTTELIEMIRNGNFDIAKKLIQDGANVNILDDKQISALCYSVNYPGKTIKTAYGFERYEDRRDEILINMLLKKSSDEIIRASFNYLNFSINKLKQIQITDYNEKSIKLRLEKSAYYSKLLLDQITINKKYEVNYKADSKCTIL